MVYHGEGGPGVDVRQLIVSDVIRTSCRSAVGSLTRTAREREGVLLPMGFEGPMGYSKVSNMFVIKAMDGSLDLDKRVFLTLIRP